jgi:hypothetical protein
LRFATTDLKKEAVAIGTKLQSKSGLLLINKHAFFFLADDGCNFLLFFRTLVVAAFLLGKTGSRQQGQGENRDQFFHSAQRL